MNTPVLVNPAAMRRLCYSIFDTPKGETIHMAFTTEIPKAQRVHGWAAQERYPGVIIATPPVPPGQTVVPGHATVLDVEGGEVHAIDFPMPLPAEQAVCVDNALSAIVGLACRKWPSWQQWAAAAGVQMLSAPAVEPANTSWD